MIRCGDSQTITPTMSWALIGADCNCHVNQWTSWACARHIVNTVTKHPRQIWEHNQNVMVSHCENNIHFSSITRGRVWRAVYCGSHYTDEGTPGWLELGHCFLDVSWPAKIVKNQINAAVWHDVIQGLFVVVDYDVVRAQELPVERTVGWSEGEDEGEKVKVWAKLAKW